METTSQRILSHAAELPEGTPLTARELWRLGKRPALDQALTRLTKRQMLVRAGPGIYMCPVKSRFGARPPETNKAVKAVAQMKGETVVRHGAAAANALGLTTQVPVREVYLTSGRSRQLKLGAQVVEMKHVSPSKLILAGRTAGEVIRALEWLGPEQAPAAIEVLKRELPQSELDEVEAARGRLPSWLAEALSHQLAHG